MILTAIWFTNISLQTSTAIATYLSTDWLGTTTYTLWTITWHHKKKRVDELYNFRIGNTYYPNNREEHPKYKKIGGIDDVMSLKDEKKYKLVLQKAMIWTKQFMKWKEQDMNHRLDTQQGGQ